MFVPVKEADLLPESSEDVCFMHGDGFHGDMVEQVDQPRGRVPDVVDVELVDDQWDTGVEKDPTMELQLRCVGDFVRLLKNGDFFIEVCMVHIQDLDEPVAEMPL